MQPTAGITGAGGFIGKALAKRLHAQGYTVVGLDLSDAAAPFYASLGGRLLKGDISDPAAAGALCRDAARIYHTAAIVKESGDPALFEKVNVEGTRVMLDAAEAAGVREFFHFSSVMVYGFSYPDGVTEEGPLCGDDNVYCDTKMRSELIARERHRPDAFDVYVIRPGDVYGPGSIPWTVRPVEMMKKRLWTYTESRRCIFNHVYIDNLLDAVELLAEKKAGGRPYAVTDDARTTVREFFSYYQRFLGIGFIPDVPGWIALPLADLAEGLGKLLKIDLGINRQGVRYMLRRHAYSIEAVKALGYRPRVSLDQGMEACRAWLTEEGMI
jgi:nucleoside-diphosphate-sugar epimerase